MERAALKDVCEVSWGDTNVTKASYVDTGYPAFSASGCDGFLPHFDHDGPGIVLSAIGAQCGKTWFTSGKWSCIKNTIYIKATACDVDIRYVFYALSDPVVWPKRGAAQPFISQTDARNVEIPLPPGPIQRRIAGILSAYDELIENSQRRIKILESMARALYREWFVHLRFPGYESVPRVPSPLGEIPQGWEVKRISDISSYINRGITPLYDEEGDSFVINQKCVRDQRLNLEPARRQSKVIPREKQVCFGDVLINSTGVGTLGRVAQVYENLEFCTVDTHVTIARAAPDTDLDFYGCCLLSFQETFERLGIGATGQTELSRLSISDVELVVPTNALQRQFGEVVRGMRMAASNHARQIQNLRRTRDLLLPRLLSGQIDVESIVS